MGLSTNLLGTEIWLLISCILFLGTLCVGALALHRQGRKLRTHQAETETAVLQAAQQTRRCQEIEEALRESEESLRLLAGGMKESSLFALDEEGKVQSWNEPAQRLYGFRSEEVLGQSFSCLFVPEDADRGKPAEELRHVLSRGRFEDRCQRARKGKPPFWAHIVMAASPSREGRARRLLVLTRDITEQKRAEEALQSSRVQYRNLTETARDIVMTIALEGAITSVNAAFEKITGWPRGEWIGRPFVSLLHGEDRPRAEGLLRDLARGASLPSFELRLQLPSGEHVTVDFTATPQMQLGKVTGWLGIARDLTDRKHAEQALRQSGEMLERAQKMEAVGRLAGGVAHDFNNLLTIINGFAEVVLRALPADDSNRSSIQQIQRAGERAASLTRQLLAFSRKQVLHPQVLDLNDLLNENAKMLRRLIGEDIELTTVSGFAPCLVKIDPGQIEQVLMNLAINARDAMPDGGKLTIATRKVEQSPEPSPAPSDLLPGLYVLLSVSDTGCGMTEEVQKHMFEPFFTTKEKGKGTGLGLAMVYGIVKQSGGHAEVVSRRGHGTMFRIYLPLVEETHPDSPTELLVPAPRGGTETVLLVEDEDGVRLLAQQTMAAAGYNVLRASDGPEALALCERHSGSIDLLVTDVVMPQMSGVMLAGRLARRYPTLKVVYMSGYNDSTLLRRGVQQESVTYLQKPFGARELLSCLREALGRKAGVLDAQE
jgi:two-component system, cell cycle sensor histidine kinase and response regulator CckA